MGNRKLKNKSKIIILALILFVPGFLYIAVNRLGSNQYARLPVFGEKRLTGEMKRNWGRAYADTAFHTVEALRFRDVRRGEVLFPAADTCLSIVHLFYTRDQAFSRLLLDHVDKLATRFQQNAMIRFYSISVDHTDNQHTISEILSPYDDLAKKHWSVGYHPSSDIFSYAKEQLLIDAMPDPADSTRFLISNQLVLLDGKYRIRGFYDISVKGEVDRLEDEIKLLAVEEIRNRPIKLEQR